MMTRHFGLSWPLSSVRENLVGALLVGVLLVGVLAASAIAVLLVWRIGTPIIGVHLDRLEAVSPDRHNHASPAGAQSRRALQCPYRPNTQRI